MSDFAVIPNRIVVAIDGSDESLAAARYAIEIAKMANAELMALHVIHLPEYVSDEVSIRLKEELNARGQLALTAVRQSAQGRGVVLHERTVSTTKSVVETICGCAVSDGAGMIVLGTRGVGGVAKLMLGSVAAGVVRSAYCPVLVVR